MNIEVKIYDGGLTSVVIERVLVSILDGIFCVHHEQDDLEARVPLLFMTGPNRQDRHMIGWATVKRENLNVHADLEVFPQFKAWIQGRYPAIEGEFGAKRENGARPLENILSILMAPAHLDSRIPPVVTVKH